MININLDYKIRLYNDLVDAWEKGSNWADSTELSEVQELKALERFKQIIDEASLIYNELKEKGVEVKAFEQIKIID